MSAIRIGKRGVFFVLLLMVPMIFLLATAPASRAQVAVTVAFAPPELPVYEQPLCPAEDYIWVPGYWGWDGDDYYWVPGTWVMAPEVGFFWTPGYWGWGGGGYLWYPGYWGPTVGFYGGIVYGFGYFGHGYEGGRWDRGHFFYNRTVNNVNVTVIHNVYNTTIENRNVNVTRVSYNGGNGGVNARPTSQEEAAGRERHVAMTTAQTQHIDAARQNRELRASVNQGKPPIAASARAGEFHGQNVVAAREGGRYTPPPNRGNGAQPGGEGGARGGAGGGNPRTIHPNDLPPYERPSNTNANATKDEQKYQKQQEKVYQKQVQERQKLQQQQDREHQQAQKRQADEQYKQQMEQKHQQQTEQMQQRHVQQQQQMQQHAPAPHPAPAPHEAPPPHH